MSQTITAAFDIRRCLAQLLDTSGGVTTPWNVNFGASGIASLTRRLSAGTGANKVGKMWYARSTLGAGLNDDWVIGSGGTNCVDRFANAVTFTLVKWVIIAMVAPATGNNLKLGAAGTAGSTAAILWFGTVTDTETVHDELVKINQIDGWAVAAGKILRVNNPTAGSLTYDALVLGE